MAERNTTRPLLVSAVVFVALLIVVGVLEARLSPSPQPSRLSTSGQSNPEPADPERSTPELVATEIGDQNDDDDAESDAGLDPGDSEAEDPACVGAQGQIADLKAQATDMREEAAEIRLQADVVASEDGGFSSASMLRDTAREYDAMARDLEAEANALQLNCP